MSTTRMTVNKQTQPQSAKQQQSFADNAKSLDNSLKNAENSFAKSIHNKVKSKQPRDQIQKHTHFVHTAKEVTTQQTSAGMAQMRPIDSKDTKLKILMTQQTTVLNQERLQKIPRRSL